MFGIFSLTSIMSVRLNNVMVLLRSLGDSAKGESADNQWSNDQDHQKAMPAAGECAALCLLRKHFDSRARTVMVASSFFGMHHAFGAPLLFLIATIFLLITIAKFATELRLEAVEIASYASE